MIEIVPTIMVRVGADANGRGHEARRSDAPTEDAEGGDTHDRGTVGNQPPAAFRKSRTSDMCTPTTMEMILLGF
ncbi:MAG: hypothetical protein WA899_22420 [Candidatus Sulfotelmatobacter sp.]